MGFLTSEARLSLRACRGDTTVAVEYITRRREVSKLSLSEMLIAHRLHLIMRYMVNIYDEVCIINHRIFRYIRARENNRKYRER